MSLGDLTPERFVRDTSADHERPLPSISRGFYFHMGETGFDTFVNLQRHFLRRQLAFDELKTYAVLLGIEVERRFVGEGDEFPQDFASRLRREAAAMQAQFSFVAMMSPVAEHDQPVDATNLDAIDEAVSRGDLNVGLTWVATSRPFGNRGGVMFVDEHRNIAREVSGFADHDPFLHVLA